MPQTSKMLNRTATTLAVIDIQDVLMPKDAAVVNVFLANLTKLIRCAQGLEIPILITEQNPDRLGRTNAAVAEVLGETPRLGKMTFSCLADNAFAEKLKQLGRNQLLITGMETHVCVMQTALDAMYAGYHPFVVRDAVLATHPQEHQAGLDRLAQAGIPLVSTQMAVFEWLRAAGTPEFKRLLPLLK